VFELTPQDDFAHATGQGELWRESFAFDFYDPATRLSGCGVMGVNPNQETGDCIFALWRDDIVIAKSGKWDFRVPRDIGEERQYFGPLVFRQIAPFKTWEISYDDGYCRLELAFDSIQPPYSWLESGHGEEHPGSHYYHQQGHYRGVIRVGKESIPVQAVGAREHGWGPDARANVRRWFSVAAQFSEKFAFQALQVGLRDGRELVFGYVFRGGHNDIVQRSRLSATYTLRSSAPSGCSLELGAASGERLPVVARVLNAFNASFQEQTLPGFHFSCAAEFQAGGQKGFGRVNAFWRGSKERPEEWAIEPPSALPENLKKLGSDFDETVY